MKCSSILLLSILFLYTSAETVSNNWAVLIAGSDGYSNYRHQSDVFHAYQILISQGYSKDRIIVFAYDDIALNRENPFPGKIFNSPNGKDVYEGVVIDYKGKEVTPQNYINVILGDEEKMKGIGSGKVLKSTKEDIVFMFYSDHGSSKLLSFPQDLFIFENEMIDLLDDLHKKGNYKELIFYVEACYSASMFTRLPSTWNMYVTTAANAYQSSFGMYCEDKAVVEGKLMNTCLGDEYSVDWMNDVVANKDNPEYTLYNQFTNLKKTVKLSEVCSAGDINFSRNTAIKTVFKSGLKADWKDLEMVLENKSANSGRNGTGDNDRVAISSRDVHLRRLKFRAMTSNDPWAVIDYERELALAKRSKSIFERFRKEFGLVEGIVDGDTDFTCLKHVLKVYIEECGFGENDYYYLNDLTNACTINVEPMRIYESITFLCRLPEYQREKIIS